QLSLLPKISMELPNLFLISVYFSSEISIFVTVLINGIKSSPKLKYSIILFILYNINFTLSTKIL
ncbi:MAG: hypothetical protein LUG21_03195, partial [Clostridiales bacterium]|nr:hypothetical protein [Clostridiales bacterium]